jgi:hypothetical protein
MWTRPALVARARMPSMRPPRSAPAGRPAPRGALPQPPAQPSRDEVGEDGLPTRGGGFHESSYELRTGMDMMETQWPEDTTVPGALDELPAAAPRR